MVVKVREMWSEYGVAVWSNGGVVNHPPFVLSLLPASCPRPARPSAKVPTYVRTPFFLAHLHRVWWFPSSSDVPGFECPPSGNRHSHLPLASSFPVRD